ncbi:hypothetical protein F5H01DRAFT_353331 [Linnemannia elongata]|nr:hypothetical protein F5H01DRAFT_353331 [Linnemannia elongata]
MKPFGSLILIAALFLSVVISGTAATRPRRPPPPPTPPCQSACNSDFYKCLTSPEKCNEERTRCMRGCDGN